MADVTVFIPDTLSVNEDGGALQVCTTLSAIETTEKDLNVSLATTTGTGTSFYSPLFVTSQHNFRSS